MRVIRRVVGVPLGLVGLVVAVVGGAAAFWLIGPDDTVRSGEQYLSSKGLAIATTPELLDRHGPTLHIDVRSTKNQPVFVGVARDFDVASYLEDIGHTKLVQVRYPIALTTQDEKGTAGPLTAPATLDWWIAKATGTGTQSIAWPIEDGPHDVVIMNADGNTSPDVQVTLGIEIPHAFHTALTVFAIGIVLLVVSIFLVLFRRRPASPAPQPHSTLPPQQPQATVGSLRRTAVVGLAFAVLTGCAAVPQPDTVTALTRPAITDSAAAEVIKHYNDVNNRANRTRDDKLIATVEGDPLLRESLAGYKIDRAVDKTGKRPAAAFLYKNAMIGAPTYGSYPMRFVMKAEASTSKDYVQLGVWQRSSAGADWLHTFATWVPKTAKIPDLSGLREVTASDTSRWAAAPAAVANQLASYLTTGAKSPYAASFAPSQPITGVLAQVAAAKSMMVKEPDAYRKVTNTFSVTGSPAAFIAPSGEALVLFTITDEYRVDIGSGYKVSWNDPELNAFSPSSAYYETALTNVTLHDVALVVPPKGTGKIRILSFDSQLVDAGGY